MRKAIHQKRYSEEFKRKVLDEFRQGKWATAYAVAKAYGIRGMTVTSWIDAAGLTHLRGRAVEVRTLGEVSELNRLRKENKELRNQLLDEVLACREERAMLIAAGDEYGFSALEFAKRYRESARHV